MTKFALLLLAVLLPRIVNAQFAYTVSNNAVTITAYTGPDGAVIIPSTIYGLPVVSIQQLAFDPDYTGNTAYVPSVSIPDSVTNIDSEAFLYCDTLTSVTFGAGVASIGPGAFTFCSSLTAITASPYNPAFTTVNGVLFDKHQTTLIQCPQKLAGNYIIPDSVANIAAQAFYSCVRLTNVTIGNGVTNISEAFARCSGLESVTIGKGVTSIGYEAFSYCTGLTNVTIPTNVTSIESSAFSYCTSLLGIAIPDSVTNIGNDAFSGCTGLTNVTIPTNVTSIGNSAFYDCTSLPGIVIPGSVTNIGASAFLDCPSLASVTIPGNVVSVGTEAFASCGLTNLTIGNGVASIGAYAFSACSRLNSVLIPQSVTSLGSAAFNACSGLTAITVDAGNVYYSSLDGVLFDKNQKTLIQWPVGRGGSCTIPNSVTNIGAGAFESCVNLTNITIGTGVTGIGDSAFAGCSDLTAVYIGPRVTVIGDSAFAECPNLTALYFSGNAPAVPSDEFLDESITNAYYLPGTRGWPAIFGGIPTALWHLPSPVILTFEPNFGAQANYFGFGVSWATNIPVVVEACTNLASPVWSTVANLTLANGSAYLVDRQWTNYPNRFYRVRSP